LDLETYLQTAEEKYEKKTKLLMGTDFRPSSMHTNLVLQNNLYSKSIDQSKKNLQRLV
jgi:hypothetical protein